MTICGFNGFNMFQPHRPLIICRPGGAPASLLPSQALQAERLGIPRNSVLGAQEDVLAKAHKLDTKGLGEQIGTVNIHGLSAIPFVVFFTTSHGVAEIGSSRNESFVKDGAAEEGRDGHFG